MEFAKRCKKLRDRLKQTQGEFAQTLGIKNKQGKITIARWEGGSYLPSAGYLIKFLKLEAAVGKKKVKAGGE